MSNIFFSYRGKYSLGDVRRTDFPKAEDIDLGVAHGEENYLLFKVEGRDDIAEKVCLLTDLKCLNAVKSILRSNSMCIRT